MKPSRTFWISAAAATAIVTAVVTGVSVASADQATARPGAITPVSSTPATSVAAKPQLIHTGLDATPISEWVIKPVSVKVRDSRHRTFGFAIDDRANDGRLEEYAVIFEVTAGAELKPGFHAVEHSYGYEDGVVQPAYGYFVGAPAKITGTVDGRKVTAKKAKWRANPEVTVFWFDNTKVTGDSRLTSVSAYDAAGKRLAKARVYSEGE
jgi:hypothetical protein